jgi:hypothetical protein
MEYENTKMAGWPQKIKQSFGQRKYLYNAIKIGLKNCDKETLCNERFGQQRRWMWSARNLVA